MALTSSMRAAQTFARNVGNDEFNQRQFVTFLLGIKGKTQDTILDLFMAFVDALATGFDEGLYTDADTLNRMASAKRMQDAMIHLRR